jgi:nucleotide-binding universal stress UspA family protein
MAAQQNVDLVVVGADGSWQSQRAVESAAREAARRRGTLLVLTVARGDGTAVGLAELRRLEESAVQAARAVSKRAVEAARATDSTVPVEAVVVASLDAPELAAILQRADLLVLGGHGRLGQAAFSLGSISGELARRLRAPVLLPRIDPPPETPTIHRSAEVHVGLSGRGAEGDLVRLAAREAAQRGASLRVIRAVPRSQPGEGLQREVQEIWETVRGVAVSASVPCQVEVVQDDPVTALLARCAPDDLLVVGTRGGGTLAGLVQGSVARGVLDGLLCDVIVVPPGAREAADAPSGDAVQVG